MKLTYKQKEELNKVLNSGLEVDKQIQAIEMIVNENIMLVGNRMRKRLINQRSQRAVTLSYAHLSNLLTL